ncbi:alkaline phosphatase family protein [Carnobacterium gallinarum]|uniref:alkaline phosphatase family protein n=1 Tax=Carnobacterium gallinarum TaxID=2749 RepID=UPI00055611C0|nr:ectonucleotide pyrophosphatase/phosphodiesterase [Carnobacterium gallinarum]
MKKQRLYIISLDAFGSQDLAYAKELPNFKRLLARSAQVREVETVYPSLTYMAHTSIVTGVYPNKHGIINNTLLQPKRESPDWHWYAKDINVPTLFDIAAENGYQIASLLWPVTGGSKAIKWNFTEIFPNRPWKTQLGVSLWSSSPKYIFDLNNKYGKLRKGIQQPELDHFITASMVDTIETKNPDLFAVHLVDLDSMRHEFGVNTPETQAAIQRMDDHLGQMIAAMERMEIFEETVIAILGDHYQLDVHTVIRLNQVFKEQGWLTVNSKNQITNWQVIAKGADGACYIYTQSDVDLVQIKSVLSAYSAEIDFIYTSKEAKEMGADEKCSFLIEAKAGYYFESGLDGPLFEKVSDNPKLHKGTHGFSPKKANYATTLFISGPGINSEARLEHARLVDEGPTFLHALGLSYPQSTDGHVLTELFQAETSLDN